MKSRLEVQKINLPTKAAQTKDIRKMGMKPCSPTAMNHRQGLSLKVVQEVTVTTPKLKKISFFDEQKTKNSIKRQETPKAKEIDDRASLSITKVL